LRAKIQIFLKFFSFFEVFFVLLPLDDSYELLTNEEMRELENEKIGKFD